MSTAHSISSPKKEQSDGLNTYTKAVEQAAYDRDTGGLFGKHDNVRRYWEDQLTRYSLHAFLQPFVYSKRKALERVRVIDLGCGSGEGYEILTDLRSEAGSLATKEVDVMPSFLIGTYKGVDISTAMIDKARTIYEGRPKLQFEVADLSNGLPVASEEPPFDIYFSSFGSFSHLKKDNFRRLIVDICDHMGDQALLVADMVGRYSYEWQCYWDGPGEDEDDMHLYSMSYLYPPEKLEEVEVESFPMRYWGGEELDGFISEICASKGCQVVRREIRDRSVLVGRHMNTGEYNPHVSPLRQVVSSLHEFNQRTDLNKLLFDYIPQVGHPRLNRFFDEFQMAWNAVVMAAIEALSHWQDAEKLQEDPPEEYPEIVQQSIRTIRDVVRNVRWFRMGDPLANIVEPQLGYILRNLETDLQQGLGAAHAVVGIYELRRG